MSKLRPLKLPYGIRDGKLVHVSQVEAGKACNCKSPLDDETPLLARKGPINRAHFAANLLCDPVGALESVFHRLAKELLFAARSVALPAVELEMANETLALASARIVTDLTVSSEQIIEAGGFRADNIVTLGTAVGARTLIVEWVVTHPCEAEKLQFLRARGISSLEVEIGRRSMPLDEAKQWILFDAPRKWIWHPFFAWSELRKLGLVLIRRPAYRSVRFFKTRVGTKPVEASWVKACPIHRKIVSMHRCRRCPWAYDFDFNQDAFVDCAGESIGRVAELLRGKATNQDPSIGILWYENATPNLGSGFRPGWDDPRSDLVPEVQAELKRSPYDASPRLAACADARGDDDALDRAVF